MDSEASGSYQAQEKVVRICPRPVAHSLRCYDARTRQCRLISLNGRVQPQVCCESCERENIFEPEGPRACREANRGVVRLPALRGDGTSPHR